MSVVALRLAGPLQSWGSSSRFVRRATDTAPTKSGVLGLVAAARGIRRSDPLEALLGLRFGVRIDQPGQLVRDFQTARQPTKERGGSIRWRPLPLSQRYYMSDAVYLAVLEGEHELVAGIDDAVRSPHFPLYLGRRSCPPSWPVALGVFDDDLEGALATQPWLAYPQHQKRQRTTVVRLPIVCDASDASDGSELIRDVPVSFDPNRRQYTWRRVVRRQVEIANPHGIHPPSGYHDPMSALEG
ncbi:type I-E CRISPR-associated protein Cas5/CasD [Mycobacterium celatum]|uniref:CRISPR-associated protein Cas5 n=1 Tax=Mycobacterium celatum TaxID=28045 RepID=A0A1X1RUQ1_MYCCE|nr:type I-E CRISPR-associated protein Cas5/CasD [Mycobacterium celatum]ORV18169.1 CRISPR-associated protein Cas5 [Mycobacterium celatum]PIB80642.1 type I-E CRISPR-associated protein Cas5/CasD [Mycobacterium celatum]